MLQKLITRPFQLLAALQSAWVEEQTRSVRRLSNFPRALQTAFDARVGMTPREVIYRRGSLELSRYRRSTPATQATPVLFCYALVNRPYILDLQPDKSVVQRYLERGFDVYIIDWGVPSYADRTLTLQTYVCELLSNVVAFICREHPCSNVNLLGYCMGGTLATLFTALEPQRVATLTLLAAPIEFGGRASLLELWSRREYFDVDTFIDANGNCPAWFLQLCFLNTRPVQNFIEKGIGFYEQMDNPRFVANYFAMERWVNDNIPVAGETFREFVKKLYQENQLVRGELRLGEHRVDLGRITCPLLLLTANNDHLVAPASTHGIEPYVRSPTVTSMSVDAGHVGLVVSGKAHQTFWPEATRWLAAQQGSVIHGHSN